MFTKIRASLDDPWTKGLVVVAVIAAILALILLLAGCGEEGSAANPCVGTVTKTYTTTSVSGGFSGVPATSSTQYRLAIKRADGTFCSRKIKKDDWLAINEGDTYG